MTRRVVVTGASSGIGRAVVEACAARGDAVFAVGLEGVSGLAMAAGWARCDVSAATEVDRAASEALATLGGIDLVVHAAGVSAGGPSVEAEPLDQRWIIDVNVLGTFNIGRSFGRLMVSQTAPSRIVFVGSEHSLGMPHSFAAAYTASKHAVLGYADVLRRELPPHVSVSVLCPGLVATELWRSTERRGDAYGGGQPGLVESAAVMAEGMPPEQVAEALLRGIENGEFLIVTHGHARSYARERWELINGAFERQAPDEHDHLLAVGTVTRRVRAARGPQAT